MNLELRTCCAYRNSNSMWVGAGGAMMIKFLPLYQIWCMEGCLHPGIGRGHYARLLADILPYIILTRITKPDSINVDKNG